MLELQPFIVSLDISGGYLLRNPSPTRRTAATTLRIRTVISPRTFMASVEIGSFSRRIACGIRKPTRTARPGELRAVTSGKGYAKYVAGLVNRRVWTGDEERVVGNELGRVGSASSVNFEWNPEDIVRR